MWVLVLLQLCFANCEFPFPLQVKNKIVSACFKSDRKQDVGHLSFIEMPRAVYSVESNSSVVQYFANTAETRQRLCQIVNKKRQIADYALFDKSGGGITYGKNGFTIDKEANTLKMLACSVL